jgi:tetratricopeptide (TPR) repeat protein
MSEKVIKPCAIVPQKLYVHREADKQLRQIIHDMGRPGYVLVSRQMGKTNLLLNAKREFDSENDSFAYLDVSNSFSDIRDFFRNIVDTILDGELTIFASLAKTIGAARKESVELQPHKEHELELRTILSSISGKLIICLDEIDALTKVDYSDKVFSQIRSMYFSGRTNFPDFTRLTYVLSGVADPAELIKNKAISPFNIGAKIYLNDFTLQETLHFVTQCSMTIEQTIVERIYHWASGNPRVTWEICSELESNLIAGSQINEATVDELVKTLYLANFDLPPVDHIRTIAASDREITSAIMSIHYGKSDSLTDRIKDRLYLAGITTSKAPDGSIRFRNQIVAEAVSERWVKDLEKSLLSVSERVLQCFDAEDYDGIISLYEKNYDEEFDDISVDTQFKIGYAYVKTNLHPQALIVFKNAMKGLDIGEDHFIFQYWMGICNLVTGEIDTAIENFNAIVYRDNARSQGFDYFQSCMNLSVAYFRSIFKEDYSPELDDIVEKIQSNLINVIDAKDEIEKLRNESLANQLSYSAYYQLHSLYSWKKEPALALRALDQGILFCTDSSIIKFLIAKTILMNDDHEKNYLIEQCAKEIVDRKLAISINRQNNPLLLAFDDLIKILYWLARNRSYDSFARLVNYLYETEEEQIHSCAAILHSTAIRAARLKDYVALSWITNSAVALLTGRAKKDEIRKLISLSLVMATNENVGDLKEKFIQDFLSDDSPLPLSDLSAIYVLVMLEIENNNITAARHIVDSSIVGWSKTSEDLEEGEESSQWKLADCVVRYLTVLVNTLEKNFIDIPVLIELHSQITALQDETLPYFTKDANKTMLRTLDAVVKFQQAANIDKALIGIDRKSTVSVQLSSGEIKTGKLKTLLPLIKSGRAVLLRAAN